MPNANPTHIKTAELLEQFVCHALPLDKLFATISDWRVRKALALIHAAPQLDWNCASLAELFHLNADYFGRLFTANLGMGVSHYVELFRVTKARRLLKNTDLFLYEIAEELGMPNELALRRAFKRTFGNCPSRCRE